MMELEQAVSVLTKTGSLMMILLVFILISILILGVVAIAFIKIGRWIYVRMEVAWKESKESILENNLAYYFSKNTTPVYELKKEVIE